MFPPPQFCRFASQQLRDMARRLLLRPQSIAPTNGELVSFWLGQHPRHRYCTYGRRIGEALRRPERRVDCGEFSRSTVLVRYMAETATIKEQHPPPPFAVAKRVTLQRRWRLPSQVKCWRTKFMMVRSTATITSNGVSLSRCDHWRHRQCSPVIRRQRHMTLCLPRTRAAEFAVTLLNGPWPIPVLRRGNCILTPSGILGANIASGVW